jgi:hypothetical protein
MLNTLENVKNDFGLVHLMDVSHIWERKKKEEEEAVISFNCCLY